LRFLRKTTNTLETSANAGFACILGKFEYDSRRPESPGVVGVLAEEPFLSIGYEFPK
jgi:hypothetical protein